MKRYVIWMISLVMAATVFLPAGTASAASALKVQAGKVTAETASVSWSGVPKGTDHFLVDAGGDPVVVSGSKTSYKMKNLKEHTQYKIRVRAVNADESQRLATASVKVTTAFKKSKAGKIKKITPQTGLKSAVIKYSRGSVFAKGYQVQIYQSGKWKNVAKNTKKKTVTVKNLKKFKTYKVRVRYYRMRSGEKVWSKWAVKSFVNTGALDKYHYYNEKGKLIALDAKMWKKVKNSKSKSKYLIAVNRDKNRLLVYTGEKGNWKLKYYWLCGTGREGHRTPTTNRLIKKNKKIYHFGHGYTCWYATNFWGNRVHFHSVLYQPGSKTNVQGSISGQLGRCVSHGCIRLRIENAKWIYDNIYKGTRVIVYGN